MSTSPVFIRKGIKLRANTILGKEYMERLGEDRAEE